MLKSRSKPRTWASCFRQSSLHGLKYLASNTLVEKFFWCTILIISTSTCVLIGLQSVDRFRIKNTVVSIERDFYYWHTAAPSTTVCPLVQRLNQTLIQEFCSQHNLDNNETKILSQYLEELSNATYFNFQYLSNLTSNIEIVLKKINLMPGKYMELIYNLTSDQIRTKSVRTGIGLPVRQVLTEYGICYSTNTFLSEKLSANYLINGKLKKSRVCLNCPGLKALVGNDLYSKKQIMEISYYEKDATYIFEGFYVPIDFFIHSAFDTIQLDHNYGYTNSTTYHEFESMETIVEERFQNSTSVLQRKCRFQNESNLLHFPIYTRNLCLQECRLKNVYEKCKCIPHFYPNRISSPKKVCAHEELIKCVAPNSVFFLKLYMENGENTSMKGIQNCHCLPNCEDAIVNKKTGLKLDHTENLLNGNSIMITMVNPPRQRLKRQIIFSATELLVSIGGTAGLFLGFSFLTAIEVLHWMILLCCRSYFRNF